MDSDRRPGLCGGSERPRFDCHSETGSRRGARLFRARGPARSGHGGGAVEPRLDLRDGGRPGEGPRVRVHLHKVELAIRSVPDVLEDVPASVPARLALADAYLMAARLADAKSQAEDILKPRPGRPAALKIKPNAEYLLGNVGAP